MLTVKAVAERLSVSEATVYSLIESGKLRHHRIGMGRGTIRVTEEFLQEFLDGTEVTKASAPRQVKLKHLRL
jgi:excisionase family DNA binding protein